MLYAHVGRACEWSVSRADNGEARVKNPWSGSGALSECGKIHRSVSAAWSGRSWSENGTVSLLNWPLTFCSNVIVLKFLDVTNYRV